MSGVIQTMPLDFQWPIIDPFLFCVHHVDAYPPANGSLGPAAVLECRELGSDFAGIDGWRMYHGDVVPGFPQHPHRGFETVTYVRKGVVDHSDSLGATARYGRGDVQWLTAGRGIVHAEMFPLLDTDNPNPVELFQIWINLARSDKMAEPYFTMLWDDDIPNVVETDGAGRSAEITVIAGALAGHMPPQPPPDSWAARDDSDVAIWHVKLDAGARWTMPAARFAETVRCIYLFEGPSLTINGEPLPASTGAVVQSDLALELAAESAAECLVLQGRPIGEPVVQYGPFVMNDRAGVQQAFDDYQRTGFGHWPWPDDALVHGHEPDRFVRRPNGEVERPGVARPLA